MQPDATKEQIAGELRDRAAQMWGAERAGALRSKIDQTAGWLSLIAQHTLEIDRDEPDFLVSAGGEGEVA
ncbi:MAG: hypothetical protein ACYC3V_18110 [Chloroflexota bacterium]